MLPAHLQLSRMDKEDAEDSSDETDEARRHQQRLEFPAKSELSSTISKHPPLGLTGVLCDSHSITIPQRGVLHYTVFRPRNLDDQMPPPLVCMAGGPLMPSTYLSPLVHLITNRSIVFYNPLGVGQSKADSHVNLTDIKGMVFDFDCLISRLPVKHFHLLGHSFGGILAYEYLCHQVRGHRIFNCLSVILSSAPVSVQAAMDECNVLLDEIRIELGNDGAEETDVQNLFSQRHECRTQPIPLPLQQSYQMAGFYSSPKGLVAVQKYVARRWRSENDDCLTTRNLPPALILRGQYDFVTSDMANAWGELFPTSQSMTLAGCSHFAMLEDESMYKSILDVFLRDNDPAQDDFIVLPNGVKVRR
jgi:proline iminopeptidase